MDGAQISLPSLSAVVFLLRHSDASSRTTSFGFRRYFPRKVICSKTPWESQRSL